MSWPEELRPQRYPVTVTTVDKYTGDVRTTTAVLMQNKARIALRALIEASAQTLLYTLEIMEERGDHRRLAGRDIWETPYYVQFKDV